MQLSVYGDLMLVKGLVAILDNKDEIRISIKYDTQMDTDAETLLVSAHLILPELNDSNKSYSSYIYRSIPITEPIDSTQSFKILYESFSAEYIKRVLTPHVEEYYKSIVASWIDVIL